MKSNADSLSVVRDEEGNLRVVVGRGREFEVLVLSEPDAHHLRQALGRKLDAPKPQVASGAGEGFPVTLVQLNDGSTVVGHADGGAKHYMARSQAERAAAKLDDSYEVWHPAQGRSFYVRRKPEPAAR